MQLSFHLESTSGGCVGHWQLAPAAHARVTLMCKLSASDSPGRATLPPWRHPGGYGDECSAPRAAQVLVGVVARLNVTFMRKVRAVAPRTCSHAPQ